jgi:hypothetical protein
VEAVGLLCSRSAQWETNQPPSLKRNEPAWRDDLYYGVVHGRSWSDTGVIPERGHEQAWRDHFIYFSFPPWLEQMSRPSGHLRLNEKTPPWGETSELGGIIYKTVLLGKGRVGG